MRFERGVYRWPGLDPIELGQRLRDDDWCVLSLPDEIVDKSSFFEGVRNTLPQDPPLGRTRDVWDALSDSVWGGLHEHESERIAIIWPDSVRMIRHDPQEFGIAFETFHTTIELLADSEATVGHPKQVVVVLT